MNYNLYKKIALVSVSILLFTACSEHEGGENGVAGDKELLISPTVGDMGEILTKGYANNFFDPGDTINVTVKSSSGDSTLYYYIYGSDGIFRGDPGYHFSLDDHYISSLRAVWPRQANGAGIFNADQRDSIAFRQSDWLVATASASGVMPTDVPVPLHFEHNNCLLEFELVGQNTSGLRITELLMELFVNGQATACWAYCGQENGRAAYLLPPGTVISGQEGTLVGTIPGANNDTYTIILPEIDLSLVGGYRYLVTLLPRGYDMDIYVSIYGFNGPGTNDQDGIGIPFHLPAEGEEGDYIIYTPAQLITMSYLMRHYTDGTTVDWPSMTYRLTDGFTMTAEYATMYIPVPLSLPFTGEVIYNGESVTEIPYDGGVLQLFE